MASPPPQYPKCAGFDPPRPPGLEKLLEDISLQVLSKHPDNIYCFLHKYLSNKDHERNGTVNSESGMTFPGGDEGHRHPPPPGSGWKGTSSNEEMGSGSRRLGDESLQKRLSAAQDLIQSSIELGNKLTEKYRRAESLQLLPSDPTDVAANIAHQETILREQLSVVQELIKEAKSGVHGGPNYCYGKEFEAARAIEELICKEVHQLLAQVRNMTRALDQAQVSARTLEELGRQREEMGCLIPPRPITMNNETQYSDPDHPGQELQSPHQPSDTTGGGQMAGQRECTSRSKSLQPGMSYANLPYTSHEMKQSKPCLPPQHPPVHFQDPQQGSKENVLPLDQSQDYLRQSQPSVCGDVKLGVELDQESPSCIPGQLGELPPRDPTQLGQIEIQEGNCSLDQESLGGAQVGVDAEGIPVGTQDNSISEGMREEEGSLEQRREDDGGGTDQEASGLEGGKPLQSECRGDVDAVIDEFAEYAAECAGVAAVGMLVVELEESLQESTEEVKAKGQDDEGALEKSREGEEGKEAAEAFVGVLILSTPIGGEIPNEVDQLAGRTERNGAPPGPSHTFSPGSSRENLAESEGGTPASPAPPGEQDLAPFFSGQFELVRQVMCGERSMSECPMQVMILGTGVGLLGYGLAKGVWGVWGWGQDGGQGSLISISPGVAEACYRIPYPTYVSSCSVSPQC